MSIRTYREQIDILKQDIAIRDSIIAVLRKESQDHMNKIYDLEEQLTSQTTSTQPTSTKSRMVRPRVPTCRHDTGCVYPNCKFLHPNGRAGDHPTTICWRGTDCIHPHCKFEHPSGRHCDLDDSYEYATDDVEKNLDDAEDFYHLH